MSKWLRDWFCSVRGQKIKILFAEEGSIILNEHNVAILTNLKINVLSYRRGYARPRLVELHE